MPRPAQYPGLGPMSRPATQAPAQYDNAALDFLHNPSSTAPSTASTANAANKSSGESQQEAPEAAVVTARSNMNAGPASRISAPPVIDLTTESPSTEVAQSPPTSPIAETSSVASQDTLIDLGSFGQPGSAKSESQLKLTASNDILQDLMELEPGIKAAFANRESLDDADFMDSDDDDDDFRGSTRIPTLLEFVGRFFPEIYDLSMEQVTTCHCDHRSNRPVYGLDNSIHNDNRQIEPPKDLRQKYLNRVTDAVRAIQHGLGQDTLAGGRSMAIQLLTLDHGPDCPYVQLLEIKHPDLFGTAAAIISGGSTDDLVVRPSHLRQMGSSVPTHEYYGNSGHHQQTQPRTEGHHRDERAGSVKVEPSVSLGVGRRGVMGGGLSASRWAN